MSAACASSSFDWDFRHPSNGFNSSKTALSPNLTNYEPDANGVITYENYQAAIAQAGETVAMLAQRLGQSPQEIASINALRLETPLRAGEVVILPKNGSLGSSLIPYQPSNSVIIDQSDILENSALTQTSGTEVLRHQVRQGETIFTIARLYNVNVKSLIDWNNLDSSLTVQEGQYIAIPIPQQTTAPAPLVTTNESTTLSDVNTLATATTRLPSLPKAKPALPSASSSPVAPPVIKDQPLKQESAPQAPMEMPVSGSIIRAYSKGKNDGVDIAAPAGSSVKAAKEGSVAAITSDTGQTSIIVIRHSDGLLTVYSGVDNINVKKGDVVTRGQQIAKLQGQEPAFLHFEVRRGTHSVDPEPFFK